jgi:hypothetical protein
MSLVSINVWRLAWDKLKITCNFLYCNHRVHRDFLITLYIFTLWKLFAFREVLPFHEVQKHHFIFYWQRMERQRAVEDTDNKIQLNFTWLEWRTLQLCAMSRKKEDKITLYGFCYILYPVDILMNSSELTFSSSFVFMSFCSGLAAEEVVSRRNVAL